VRLVELTAAPGGGEPEVFISPGLSTGFYFDAELLREEGGQDTVQLERREAFKLVDTGQATLRLVPSDALKPGSRLRLKVRFADGAAPAGAAFTLVVDAARGERLVEVYRDARPVESYARETQEAHAATARCLESLERVRSERAGPGGLMGLLASGQLDDLGVRTRDLQRAVTPAPGNALPLQWAVSYRSATHVAVELRLRIPEGARRWMAGGAALLGTRGQVLKALTFWQAVPGEGLDAEIQRIVVETDAAPGELQGRYTLKLWEVETGRAIVLENVRFP
jgi:uncharacterized protein (TIGR02268 family)